MKKKIFYNNRIHLSLNKNFNKQYKNFKNKKKIH